MKRVSFFLGLAVGIGVLLSLSVIPAHAQTASSGSVTGQVADPQGSSVPGADVALLDTATKSTQTTTTNDSGRYNFPVVHPGVYDITVSKSGFKVAKMAQQKVSLGLVLTVNVALEVGSLSETVIVAAAAAGTELQTANATIGVTLTLKELELLPNLGRDATTLMTMQPGVHPTGFVAGAYADQNSFSIDGGNNTDDMAGNTISYISNFTGTAGTQTNAMASGVVATPIESIEEFKVSTFGQTADFNGSSGANVQMVTKRGTDNWHGSGYGYYFAPNILGANTWTNNHTQFTKGTRPADGHFCSPGTTLNTGDTNCILPYTPIIPSHRSRFGFTASGPMIPFKVLGGKTFVFVNYEGFRFPNSGTFQRNYPTEAMRKGVIQVPDTAGVWQPYNLNPFPVTVTVGNPTSTTSPLRTVTLQPATCSASPNANKYCDPRGIGLNPVVNQIWSNFLPLPNNPINGDLFNTQGYLGTISLPLTSNNYVGRIDHDFNSKHRFFTSFRAFKLLNVTSNQVDVGGLLSGGKVGDYQSTAPRPQLAELWVIGLTSSLTPTVTNDLRLSYLWNWWEWGTKQAPPQLPGLGGAVEIAPGASSNAESTAALIPYNVNTQNTRTRFWDGQDKMIRDDVTWVKGDHLFQFGGLYQRNFNWHSRNDNGQGVQAQIVYQIARQAIDFSNTNAWIPSSVISAQRTRFTQLYSEVLGLMGQSQVAYTRTGSDLKIQPVGTQAFDKSIIPTYNVYFSDTWRMKPSFTLTYGVGYTVEMPPVEEEGKQVALVYQDKTLVRTTDYLAKRKAAALAGQVYNPPMGFITTGNLGLKYPYDPFYGGLSPRVSAAWNPHFKSGLLGKVFGDGQTVLRAGYGRVFGRLNGVNLVLVPLLGVGLIQSVSCSTAHMNGTCLTSGSVDPSNVFRIGTDGLVAPLPGASATLAQPFFTGRDPVTGLINPAAADATMLDPDYKPEKTDNFDFTIQRQFGRKVSVEVGYMGRRIRNIFQEINLDAVPYMTTLGGQQFGQAYANLFNTICAPGLGAICANNINPASPTGAALVPVQPFFEAALGGASSAFCNQLINNTTFPGARYPNCSAAVAGAQLTNISNGAVSQLWQALNRANGWTLGRTMISSDPSAATTLNMTTSLGFGNYNAAFVTLRIRDWHGITAVSNFTWGRALGTGELGQANSSNTALDVWNLQANYGSQNFDIKFLYNLGLTWQPTFFKSHKGLLGHVLNGWSFSPFVTAESGRGVSPTYSEGGCTGCQAFGEVTPPGSSSASTENAVFASPYIFGTSAHFNIRPTSGPGSNNPEGINMFTDPSAAFLSFRRCILGADTSCGGFFLMRGLPRWNMDAAITKDFKFGERVSLRMSVQFTNVLNHFQPSNPSLSLTSPDTFGVIGGNVYGPRQAEWGARISF